MRSALAGLIGAFALLPFLIAADAPAPVTTKAAAVVPYTDPTYGFTVNPPRLGAADTTPSIAIVFTAPAKNAFSANINVLIDPEHTSRKEYLEVSMDGLRKSNAKFNSTKELTVAGYEAEILDYEATRNTRELHFLQMLVVTEDKVYVITCTATAESFAEYLPEFQKCIDSFRPPVVAAGK